MIWEIISLLILGFAVLAVAFKRMPNAKKILRLFGILGIVFAFIAIMSGNALATRFFHIWSVGIPFLMLFLILGSVE
ncbi:MAG: hypothetical protein QXN62_08615 [Candidatus Bathyarchaeia archaeon]